MPKYGLRSTYDRVLCNEQGEEFCCENYVEANRLRLSINADIDRLAAENAELQRRLDAFPTLEEYLEFRHAQDHNADFNENAADVYEWLAGKIAEGREQ